MHINYNMNHTVSIYIDFLLFVLFVCFYFASLLYLTNVLAEDKTKIQHR
jgi:hypothetical protein